MTYEKMAIEELISNSRIDKSDPSPNLKSFSEISKKSNLIYHLLRVSFLEGSEVNIYASLCWDHILSTGDEEVFKYCLENYHEPAATGQMRSGSFLSGNPTVNIDSKHDAVLAMEYKRIIQSPLYVAQKGRRAVVTRAPLNLSSVKAPATQVITTIINDVVPRLDNYDGKIISNDALGEARLELAKIGKLGVTKAYGILPYLQDRAT